MVEPLSNVKRRITRQVELALKSESSPMQALWDLWIRESAENADVVAMALIGELVASRALCDLRSAE